MLMIHYDTLAVGTMSLTLIMCLIVMMKNSTGSYILNLIYVSNSNSTNNNENKLASSSTGVYHALEEVKKLELQYA